VSSRRGVDATTVDVSRKTVAGFPVAKSFDDFKVQQSSLPQTTFDYICSLEWIRAKRDLCLIGPAVTGKFPRPRGHGHAAVKEGMRVRYLSAAELVEILNRGLADNSVEGSSIQLRSGCGELSSSATRQCPPLNGPCPCSTSAARPAGSLRAARTALPLGG
jgi:hypothetical protein